MVLLKSNIPYITISYIIIRHPSLSMLLFSSFVGYDANAFDLRAFLVFFQALRGQNAQLTLFRKKIRCSGIKSNWTCTVVIRCFF